MTWFVCISYVSVTLFILSRIEGIQSTGAVQKLFSKSPTNDNSKRIDFEYHQKGEEVPVILPEVPWCHDSNVVDLFTSKFTYSILSYDGLSEIYITTFSPEEAEMAYNRVVYNAVDNVNTCYPKSVSRIVADAIRETFGNLTATTHIQMYGHAVGTYLKSKKVLTCENFCELCDAFVFYVKQTASNVPRIKDRRNAFIQAASDGLVHFLTSMDLYTAGTVRTIAQYAADALYLVTGVPKCDTSAGKIDETMHINSGYE